MCNCLVFRIRTMNVVLEAFMFQIMSAYIHKVTACETRCLPFHPRDCQDVQYLGHAESGLYHVIPERTFIGYDVSCDMETAGGGWLAIQRRVDDSVDFFRGWDDYERGFGNITGNFWLGNAALHTITSQGAYELRVELLDWEGETKYAEYKTFKVASMEEGFKLSVSGYFGNAGDALRIHNGHVFSTKDRNNNATNKNGDDCSTYYTGAWWYNNCHHSNLNGRYLHGEYNSTYSGQGINWKQWKDYLYSLKTVEMKIRRT